MIESYLGGKVTEQVAFFIGAAVLVALMPLVPKIVVFRIRVLRFLHLTGFADWHERNFRVVAIALRSILAVIAAGLLIIGICGR